MIASLNTPRSFCSIFGKSLPVLLVVGLLGPAAASAAPNPGKKLAIDEEIAKGKTLFQTKICFTCHQTDPKVPSISFRFSPKTGSPDGPETALYAGRAHKRGGGWQTQATQTWNNTDLRPRLARNRGALVHLAGDIRFIFTNATFRDELGTSNSLLSPTDPKCKRTNDQDSKHAHKAAGHMDGWGRSWWNSAYVHQRGLSYGLHKSADELSGSASITLFTRNFEGDNPTGSAANAMNNWTHNWAPVHRTVRVKGVTSAKDEEWIGASGDKRYAMSGLDENQGTLAWADGSVKQVTSIEMQMSIKQNIQHVGATYDPSGQVCRGGWH